MADLATLKARLEQAELAEHLIATGQQKVAIAYSLEGNNQVTFNQASLPALQAYISRLTSQIERIETGRPSRRAFRLLGA